MHETDMTKALMQTVHEWWQNQPVPPKIQKVHLLVGEFTCVEPVSLQFAFEVQTQNTFLAGVELVIKQSPLIAYCHPCQQEYFPKLGQEYACPSCHSPMEDIRSGRELKIDHIEYTTEESVAIQ
ncbi:MAG: hydrogenase maturation nickel metallochaperone HypA [Cyanobacteria bacterium]|jgi:hydrogenase nickel incorporation protein HypA/HybF|nr:hydrogenase maturation nickel metallochaperone HypA [Cyanobacteria bacterium GSL.Bin1]